MTSDTRLGQEKVELSTKAPQRKLNSFISFFLTFILMFGLWIVFSGKFEPMLLTFGILASLLVSGFSHKMLFPHPNLIQYPLTGFRFIAYTPWLIHQILKANLHLLYLVFHPKMIEKIDPHIVYFQTKLRKDFSIVIMANSITLTPGTITVNANKDGEFRVHAIDRASSKELPGIMGQKVARIYGEDQ